MDKRTKQPEVEIIPPQKVGAGGKHGAVDPLAKDPLLIRLAALMDSAFVIPGTTIRIGLDPIIGIIPVLGDVIGTFVSTFIIVRCGALGLPRIVIARMVINVVLNTLIGVIPGVGDAFSIWFRSNDRNLALARGWMANPKRTTTRDWAAVLGILAALLVAAVGIVWLLAAILQGAWKLASAMF